MKRVRLTIRFVRPCLGGVRSEPKDMFERDPVTGKIVFMNSWWQSVLEYGARALNKNIQLVPDTLFDLYVDAPVCDYRRHHSRGVTVHEAFCANTELSVDVLLPDGMSVDDFREMMELAGRFRGISPYGWRDGFGRFDVTEVANV